MMFKATRAVFLAGATVSALLAEPALASSQGSFGPTSTGSVTIKASVPGRVRISGLTDVTFSDADPLATATKAQDVCVWSNTSTRAYTITATGSGASDAFTLASGSLPEAPYTVEWAQTSGKTSGTSLVAATALTGQTSAAINADCSAGPASSASLVVSMAPSTLQSMTSGVTYQGTLTLVVAPE